MTQPDDASRRYFNGPSSQAPAYNSFMYPAPPPAWPLPSPAPAAPMHAQTFEDDVPAIHVVAPAFVHHPQSGYQEQFGGAYPLTFSPPTSLPEMVAPSTPSSDGAHSPALPESSWPPARATVPNWAGLPSYETSPQQSELYFQQPTWEPTSPYAPSSASGSEFFAPPRPRSVSDGEALYSHAFSAFPDGSLLASSAGVTRRHSTGPSVGHGYSHYDDLLSSAYPSPAAVAAAGPYARARDVRATSQPSRVSSPYCGVPSSDPSRAGSPVASEQSGGDMSALAKAVVTTEPVSEASAKRRTHEARFACDLCGTRLTTKTNLEGHRKSHLGVKEFQCGVCAKPFTRDWDRKRHERTHSRKAELACGVCGKTSTRKDAFDKHRCRPARDDPLTHAAC